MTACRCLWAFPLDLRDLPRLRVQKSARRSTLSASAINTGGLTFA
jgi:hypothetical protein